VKKRGKRGHAANKNGLFSGREEKKKKRKEHGFLFSACDFPLWAGRKRRCAWKVNATNKRRKKEKRVDRAQQIRQKRERGSPW